MGTRLVTTSGPVLEKGGDLAGILTNLQPGDVLFIDEIHALHRSVEEYLYQAMEDFVIDLMIDSGANARSVQLPVPRFTLCGATTRTGLLSEPFRSRFGFISRLDYYTPTTLGHIVERAATVLKVSIDADAAQEVGRRSRGTPRVANHLLRWVRDFAQIRANRYITLQIVQDALELLAIDSVGLEEMDRRMLSMMLDRYEGGPVGLSTIAASIGEEERTVEEVIEPYLLQIGYLERTPKGRVVTLKGRQHLTHTQVPCKEKI
jgi:Holliday junction DNA helicase RuvB